MSPEKAAELLLELESVAFDGRVCIDSELGDGEILFRGGSITQARLGKDSGRAALQQLLTATQGTWSVHACPTDDATPIVSCVGCLSLRDESRQNYWDELCAHAPPAGSVLRLSAAGEFVRDTTTGNQSSLLRLIDGRRTAMQILEDSAGDPVDTMELLVNAVEHGLVQSATATHSLFPLAATEESSGLVPRISSSVRASQPGQGREVDSRNVSQVRNRDGVELLSGTSAEPDGAYEGVPDSNADLCPTLESARGSSPSERLAVAITQPFPARVRHHIGRYEILMRIGRGGMGTVYLSRLNSEETGFRRLVALKLLRSHLSRDSQAAREFIDEARIAGVVHHANVVGVSDAGFHGQQPYLVMDYVEGCSLKQLMSGWVSRSPQFLLPIVIDALSGLHAVHTLRDDSGQELRLVHCDVSPENLLVGVDGICRLTDFGVVRKANRINGAAARGKLGYVSPEQVAGQAFDHRSDIFAMGVVLWNALTGQSLFSGGTVEETMSNICNLDVATPTSLGAESFPELDRLILRALSRDPQRRFSTAEDMLTELREAALSGPGLATTRDVAAWVREVSGHELALRRLAILDASRSSAAAPREFPSSHLLPPAHRDIEQDPQVVDTTGVSTQPQGTELALVGPVGYHSGAPRDPLVSALFYDVETLLNPTQGAAEPSPPSRRETVSDRNMERFGWLTRRSVLIGVAVLLGGLASYLWTDIKLSQPKPSPQSRALPVR